MTGAILISGVQPNLEGGASFVVKLFSTKKTIQNKGGTTMSKGNVISLENSEENADVLTSLLRSGARELIKKAVQSELSEFLSQYQDMTDSEGRPLVVRNGYLPQREIMTGLGPVDIKVPKTRDRGGQGIHFRSELLPPYIKRTKSVETVLPWLLPQGNLNR